MVKDTGCPHAGLSRVVFANKVAADAWRKKSALPLGSIVVKTAGAMSNTNSGKFLKEFSALTGRGTATDSVLAADTSTFLILTVHLMGRIADGLAALLNAINSQE